MDAELGGRGLAGTTPCPACGKYEALPPHSKTALGGAGRRTAVGRVAGLHGSEQRGAYAACPTGFKLEEKPFAPVGSSSIEKLVQRPLRPLRSLREARGGW